MCIITVFFSRRAPGSAKTGCHEPVFASIASLMWTYTLYRPLLPHLRMNPENGLLTKNLYLNGHRVDSIAHGRNLSLLPILLPRLLPLLSHIMFIDIDFSHRHPSFFSGMRLFSNVQALSWAASTFPSLHSFVCLVRSMPSLQEVYSIFAVRPRVITMYPSAERRSALRVRKLYLAEDSRSVKSSSKLWSTEWLFFSQSNRGSHHRVFLWRAPLLVPIFV